MDLPSYPHIDLFAAAINALNGVLIARSPSHNRGYTFVGLLILAVIAGLGGGILRDALLNETPSSLVHSKYLLVCMGMGVLGLAIGEWSMEKSELFRTKMLSIMKSFTLPWLAILGAHKALEHDLGIVSAIVIGIVTTAAGGVIVDLFSGVTPELVRRAYHMVTTAILAAGVYAVIAVETTVHIFHITLISVAVAFTFRMFAVRTHLPEIVPGSDIDRSGPVDPHSHVG